jgi:hypothetical protein
VAARLGVALVALTLLLAGTAGADELDWLPDRGEHTDQTRTPPGFDGMAYGFPMRLHLSLGGHIDGGMGGLDPETGELLLVLPATAFRVHLALVESVTPLGKLPSAVAGVLQPPPPLLVGNTEYRLRPTWRSHLGVALSILMPGSGQWIQKSGREIGFLFFGSYLFLIGAAVLALTAPSGHTQIQRQVTAGVLFGLAGTITFSAGAHAWVAGREKVEVRVGPPRWTGEGGRGGRRSP